MPTTSDASDHICYVFLICCSDERTRCNREVEMLQAKTDRYRREVESLRGELSTKAYAHANRFSKTSPPVSVTIDPRYAGNGLYELRLSLMRVLRVIHRSTGSVLSINAGGTSIFGSVFV